MKANQDVLQYPLTRYEAIGWQTHPLPPVLDFVNSRVSAISKGVYAHEAPVIEV